MLSIRISASVWLLPLLRCWTGVPPPCSSDLLPSGGHRWIERVDGTSLGGGSQAGLSHVGGRPLGVAATALEQGAGRVTPRPFVQWEE
jgi:hypothetical protein